ncbi:MAG: hypothetical protein LBI03_09215 [Clostridiales bacterium]|jgi:hypothetical protein|nr:hypothetical protein [Clostridiales bacterium]
MTVNGKAYKFPELTFNSMCELEDMGISLTDLEQKPMTVIRGFLALAMGDIETVGKELESHIANGGNFEEILSEITKAVQNSGFFRAFTSSKDKRNPAGESKKKKPKSEQ